MRPRSPPRTPPHQLLDQAPPPLPLWRCRSASCGEDLAAGSGYASPTASPGPQWHPLVAGGTLPPPSPPALLRGETAAQAPVGLPRPRSLPATPQQTAGLEWPLPGGGGSAEGTAEASPGKGTHGSTPALQPPPAGADPPQPQPGEAGAEGEGGPAKAGAQRRAPGAGAGLPPGMPPLVAADYAANMLLTRAGFDLLRNPVFKVGLGRG